MREAPLEGKSWKVGGAISFNESRHHRHHQSPAHTPERGTRLSEQKKTITGERKEANITFCNIFTFGNRERFPVYLCEHIYSMCLFAASSLRQSAVELIKDSMNAQKIDKIFSKMEEVETRAPSFDTLLDRLHALKVLHEESAIFRYLQVGVVGVTLTF